MTSTLMAVTRTLEEEVRDELILDKNEHGINNRAVMDIEMGENECNVNNNDDRDRGDDDVYGDDNNDDIDDVRMEDESDYDDDERSENEESDDDSRENNETTEERKGKKGFAVSTNLEIKFN